MKLSFKINDDGLAVIDIVTYLDTLLLNNMRVTLTRSSKDTIDVYYSENYEVIQEGNNFSGESEDSRVTRRCMNCEYNDGCMYTSSPPRIYCTLSRKYHYQLDECDIPVDIFRKLVMRREKDEDSEM